MSHGDGTRVVRAGLPEAEQGTPFLPGPVFAGPFHLEGDVDSAPWVYTRYGNPTWEGYERALAELEGGEVVLFASGMAAAAALLLTGLRPGSAVAIDRDCYLNVRRLARTHLEPRALLPRPDVCSRACQPDLARRAPDQARERVLRRPIALASIDHAQASNTRLITGAYHRRTTASQPGSRRWQKGAESPAHLSPAG